MPTAVASRLLVDNVVAIAVISVRRVDQPPHRAKHHASTFSRVIQQHRLPSMPLQAGRRVKAISSIQYRYRRPARASGHRCRAFVTSQPQHNAAASSINVGVRRQIDAWPNGGFSVPSNCYVWAGKMTSISRRHAWISSVASNIRADRRKSIRCRISKLLRGSDTTRSEAMPK